MRQARFDGPVVLDGEGLSRAIGKDAYLRGVIHAAHASRARAVVSAVTLVEVTHPRMDRDAFHWTLSRLSVIPVTRELAVAASRLLDDAGLHGHQHAINAMMCATALSLPGDPTIYTSDPGDIRALVKGKATIVPLTGPFPRLPYSPPSPKVAHGAT
ncbi:MAG: hypothetical protein FWD59_04080 [Micrococcales bacterium]|nr:hypothetical protein [Micrococcales bacterium]